MATRLLLGVGAVAGELAAGCGEDGGRAEAADAVQSVQEAADLDAAVQAL